MKKSNIMQCLDGLSRYVDATLSEGGRLEKVGAYRKAAVFYRVAHEQLLYKLPMLSGTIGLGKDKDTADD